MKKFKTVLSLFDGISGTQVALERNGITYDNYYASEIDKYPISITQKNYPNTIQLGSVTDWKKWDIDWSSVDLVCGGFPCQSWSVAGLGLGDKDVRGMLFWTMLDVMKLVLNKNPNAKFLMENVRMKKEFEDYITFYTEAALGKVNKHLINSALVSAQNRKRFYWTNIDGIEQPQDLGLVLSDILMDGHVDRDKSHCLDASYYKGGNPKSYFEKNRRQLVFNRPCELKDFDPKSNCHHVANATDIKGNESIKRIYADTGKSPTLTTMGGGHREPKVLIVPQQVKVRKHEVDIPKLQLLLKEHRKPVKQISEALYVKKTTVEHWFRTDSSFSIPDADSWFDLKVFLNIATNEFDACITEFEIRDGKYEMADRVYNPDYKAPTVTASSVTKVLSPPTYRKLTPNECESLQTFPQGYTEGVSNTQRYRSLGNSFTVDVVAHIFKYL
jgi:DNA-cytosine methyltransferase